MYADEFAPLSRPVLGRGSAHRFAAKMDLARHTRARQTVALACGREFHPPLVMVAAAMLMVVAVAVGLIAGYSRPATNVAA